MVNLVDVNLGIPSGNFGLTISSWTRLQIEVSQRMLASGLGILLSFITQELSPSLSEMNESRAFLRQAPVQLEAVDLILNYPITLT